MAALRVGRVGPALAAGASVLSTALRESRGTFDKLRVSLQAFTALSGTQEACTSSKAELQVPENIWGQTANWHYQPIGIKWLIMRICCLISSIGIKCL